MLGCDEMTKRFWICALTVMLAAMPVGLLRADTDGTSDVGTADEAIPFDQWVEQMWPLAKARGVTRKVFDAAFKGVKPDPRVEKADSNQAEFVKPIWDYLDRSVSKRRITNGRAKLRKYNSKLRRIQGKFGVDRHVLVAIWGIETRYGRNKGSHHVIQAMASMAYNGRRTDFGRKQLLAALEILQRGDTTVARLKGSWAGAMGHTQFIPTTFNRYGVDFTGDGQRDIWRSMSDALASAANYLKQSGWDSGQPWGYEVKLPKTFDYGQSGLGVKKLTAEWVGLGVTRVDGGKFEQWALEASVIVPAGANGPAFLVFKNFRTIMRYNNAVSYALAVAYLSDRLQGRPWIRQKWPKSDRPLNSKQKLELQELLSGKGYSIGDIDGRIGPKTVTALRDYQEKSGLVPDGYASQSLLRHMRGES
jgi:membrane-bound lytic murein transglycosylase B